MTCSTVWHHLFVAVRAQILRRLPAHQLAAQDWDGLRGTLTNLAWLQVCGTKRDDQPCQRDDQPCLMHLPLVSLAAFGDTPLPIWPGFRQRLQAGCCR